MNLLKGVCLVGLCLAPLGAQEGLRVEGSVVDEEGEPITGAEISILVHRTEMDAALVERVLSERPLPKARSDADGRYSLVFDALHLFMTGERPALGLRIAKQGYQSWVEHLPMPLDNYLGSDAVLPLLTEEDYAEVVVAEPVPGMLLYLRRVGAWETYGQFGFFPWEELVIEVPNDGRVRIGLPILPNPLPHGLYGGTPLRLGFEISLWSPGRSAGPKPILAGDRVRFGAVPVNPAAGPIGARTLCRCEDGELRWFPGLFVERDALLDPFACWAPGYAVADPGEKLAALPEREGPVKLQIQDENGKGLGIARVRLFSLTALPAGGELKHILWSRHSSRMFSMGEDGEVLLGPEELAEPCFILIEAEGYAGRIERLDLARTELWFLKLERIPTASFRLHIRDAAGEPVEGAMLVLDGREEVSENYYLRQVILPTAGTSLLSDAQGVVEWTDLTPGAITYKVYARGHPKLWRNEILDLTADATLEQFVHIEPSHEFAIQVRLEDRRAVPFAPIEEMFFSNGRDQFGGSSSTVAFADSAGRIRQFRKQGAVYGNFRGAGSRKNENEFFKMRRGRRLLVEVVEQRPTAFRVFDPLPVTSWAELPIGTRSLPHRLDWLGDTFGVLFDSESPRVLALRDAPPMVFDPLEEEAREPRFWPVDFGKSAPANLSEVTIRALGIERTVFFEALEGNLAELDPEGRVHLSTWDDRAYLCLFLHPDCLPEQQLVDSGPVGEALSVDFKPGVRVHIRYESPRDLPSWPWLLIISGAEVALSPSTNLQEQGLPLGNYPVTKGMHEFDLPFAVPAGKDIEIMLERRLRGGTSVQFNSGDGPTIEVDLGMITVR